MNIYESIKKQAKLKESEDFYVAMDVENIGYTPTQVLNSSMTVGQVINELNQFDSDTKILTRFDNGYTYGAISSSDFRERKVNDEDNWEESEKPIKESGSNTTSLNYIKELAGYLQDFIDGCEKRNMNELSLPYSHLAGDALAVAGSNGGWISLTSDFSYDDDEIFNEYKPDTYEESENLTEDEEKDNRIKEFAESIDLTPLYDKLKQMSGINNIEFTDNIITRPGDIYIDIKSNDLIDQSGVFKLALKECHFETFNSGIVISKDTNEPYWWGTMDIRYQTKQGGSNGVRVLRFSYNEKPNEWLFNEEV